MKLKSVDPLYQELYVWAFLDCIERMFKVMLKAEKKNHGPHTQV